MRRLIIAIASTFALIANAQDYSKMSRYVRQLVMEQDNAVQAAGAKGVSPTLSTTGNELLAFVKAPEEAVSGYCIAHQGDIHIVKIPISEVAALSENADVERIEASQNNYEANLDSVASCADVQQIWEGQAPLTQAFTGKGALIGVVDIGIDYSHPTFRSIDSDKMRIVRAWDMLDFSDSQTYNEKKKFPIGKLLTDTDDIIAKGATADSKTEWHGTHTTAIAAGSGYDTPYRGMAPDADIYSVGCIIGSNSSYLPSTIKSLNTSTLNTLSFQRIFEYADTIGKPAVVSYSISGTQDMTNDDALLNEYLAGLTSTPGHIIVSSIGNSGTKHRYLPKTEDTDTVGGMIAKSTEKLFVVNISTQKQLKLRITDYSRDESKERTKEYSLDFLPGNKKKTSSSGLKWNDYYTKSNIPELDSMSVYIFSGTDGFDSERVGYDIFLYQEKYTYSSLNYGIEIIGDNTPAEIFVQNGELISGTAYSPTLTGAQVAGNCGSPGALPSVIGVGFTAHWGKGGLRHSISSIGPSLHGHIKPDIMASGYNVKSALNSVYRANTGGIPSVRESTYNGKQYGWTSQYGTSMSTPAVAGIIALWLEAKPTLTHDDIMDVFANTSRHPVESLSYPNNEYGYGEINAYQGLLYILGIDHIEGLQANQLTGATVVPAAGGITVRIDSEADSALPCRIYSTGGQLVRQFCIDRCSSEHTVSLQQGIYAVQVGNMGSTLVRVE